MSIKRAVCAVSGGVDSAITAYLMKQRGYQVTACFMTNWDEREEKGECSSEHDLKHAQRVCDHLGIPLVHVSFAKEYWNDVFEQVLDAYRSGLTPNPDVLCNKHIKFNRLFDYALNTLHADIMATGHYARVEQTVNGSKLLVPRDVFKDQTYFLSQVHHSALSRVVFPLADCMKPDVQSMADQIGLGFLNDKKESMGICFIGKRDDFGNFLAQFIPPIPGPIIDVDTGNIIGNHEGIIYYTVGQKIPQQDTYQCGYVIHTNADNNTVYVARGSNNPHLFQDEFLVKDPNWISNDCNVSGHGLSNLYVRVQRLMPMQPCTIRLKNNGCILVKLRHAVRAARSGQVAAFYIKHQDSVECVGAGEIRLNRLLNHNSVERWLICNKTIY